ncbi:MAG: hypothetical protein CMM76_16285 [Rhodospirillaceae bacterium]|nr:hypothetical protein [Rhodospirillaceae bacterium]|tara:strand:- start:3237 stop:4430 length:1194 start_codon:yes stop_codon:yes gene_type:complete
MALDPVTASALQAGIKAVGQFLGNDLMDRLFGKFFGGGGSDLPPLTPEQQAALEVSNALNMAQGDLYGDGQNEGFLEIVGPTFEEAVRKVQALDDSEEKTKLLDTLANNTPYDFTDLTPASITGVEELDILKPSVDLSGIDTSGLENMGPKTLDQLTPPEIYETYKDRKIDDLITDFPTDEGGKYPFAFVRAILINSANEGDKNAAQILINSGVPIDGGPGAFGGADGGMGPSQGTGPTGPSGPSGGNVGNQGNQNQNNQNQNNQNQGNQTNQGNQGNQSNQNNQGESSGGDDTGGEDNSNLCPVGFRYDPNADQCVPIVDIGNLNPLPEIDQPRTQLPRPTLNVAPRNVVKIPDSTPISSTLFKTEIGRIDSPARTLFDNVLPRNSMLTRGRYDLS